MTETPLQHLSAGAIFRALVWAILVLSVLHAATYYVWLHGSLGPLTGFIYAHGVLFDLGQEMNIPTWYSVIQLFVLAQVLTLAGAQDRRSGKPALAWWLSAGVIAYLSLDELTDLHGLWRDLTPGITLRAGPSGFDWVVPGAVVVLLVGAAFLPWLLRLPARTRNQLGFAAAVFVTGGLGMEALGGVLADETYMNPSYLAVSMLEEVLELLGVALAIRATLLHLEGRSLGLTFGA